MEIEWDDNPPYKTLIEGHGGLRQLEDDLSEVVSGALAAPEVCNMQTISNQIYELSTGIRDDNAKLLEVVISSTYNGGKSKFNPKKKRTGVRLNVAENEHLGIVFEYDNGEKRTEVLSRNVSGTVRVCNLKMGFWGKENLFAILFPKEGVVVIGEKTKVTKGNLLDAFVRAGVIFESSASRGDIAEALYNFFAVKVEFTCDVWEFPTHHGWRENVFLDANNPPYVKRREFEGLPVYEKYFSYVKPTSKEFENYFKLLSGIKSSYARAAIMIFPFYGIMQSLISENTKLSPVILNFVMLNDKEPSEICRLVQVFNRKKIGAKSLDISSKEIDEICKQSNDEVLLVDATYDEDDTDYYQDKVSKGARYLSNVFLGKRSCRDEKKTGGKAALAVFSSKKILLSGCINIIVSEEFWTKGRITEKADQTVEAVLTAFVEFVKANFLEVKRMIRKQREQPDGRKRLLEVVQEILSKFFEAEGFDMLGCARFSPLFDFEEILDDVVDTEELLENLRISVKKQISKFVVEQKGKRYGKNYIYFDFEWIYFPTKVFDRILGLEGLLPYKNDMLLELYDKKYLRKDKEGFSRKLMISGERFESYQINREFFDEVGELSIIEMGKVICDDR